MTEKSLSETLTNATTTISPSLSLKSPASNYKFAPSPFDKPSADVVLRSSDNVDFRVRSAILIEVSPFFADMFSLPQAPSKTKSPSRSEPIPMTENSRVLNILLRLCYPLVDRVPDDLTLEDTRAVLEAAMKYDIDMAIQLMRHSLLTFAKEQPLRVYAIACIHSLEPEARCAAEEAVERQMVFDHYVREMEEMSAGCYHRLLRFHALLQAGPASSFSFTSPATTSAPQTNALAISNLIVKEAGSPFNRPDADVFIVSQDHIRFRLHSTILKIASPVFADMLKNESPCIHRIPNNDTHTQALPPISMLQESSAVLRTLFGLWYPSEHNDIADADPSIVLATREAATKYAMQSVRQVLMLLPSAFSNPLQAFALGVMHGWRKETIRAAKDLLKLTLEELQALYDPALEKITSGPYYRLLLYHKDCGKAASCAVNTKISLEQETQNYNRSLCFTCKHRGISLELVKYMAMARSMLSEQPHVSVLSEPVLHETYISMLAVICPFCRRSAVQAASTLFDALKAAINRAISEVRPFKDMAYCVLPLTLSFPRSTFKKGNDFVCLNVLFSLLPQLVSGVTRGTSIPTCVVICWPFKEVV